ncbi:MAG TPA: amidohydrolase family protein [Vicinamibacterales bacterium]|jgi:imidazolonepropionase-like amidohydrolase|nr:amidohydrolase family protein [Vicinamibacterales bacterium]
MDRGFRTFAVVLAVVAGVLPAVLAGQDRVVVLRAARMFDGQDIRMPGIVVVAGTRIRAAGPAAQVPAGAQVIDLGDATLSPGFIDAHTHLTGMFIVDYKQAIIDGLRQTIPEQTLRATENLRKTVMAGVTTARDVGSSDFMDVGLRNASAAGIIPGPRMLVAVRSLSATGGHCDDQNGMRAGVFGPENGFEKGVINSPEDGRRAVRYNVKYGADVIKVCATGGVLSLTDPPDVAQLTQEELNAIVDEAHTLRKKTAAHAHGAEGAKRAVRAGIDSIEHGAFLDDEAIDLMKARGTYYIPTLMAVEGGKLVLDQGGYAPLVADKMRAAIASINGVVKKALAKGVKIGMGTDAAVYPHGRNTEEFHLLVDLGMSPLDALRAGTAVDAELLGMKGQIGTLAEGAFADVIAFPGDPRQNIRQVEKVFFVMKEGTILRQDRVAK